MPDLPECLSSADLGPLPLEEATTLPASFYTDPAMHRFELEAVLAPRWQFVAHASELAEKGDFVVRDIAGAPVLCVRGDEGQLHAFYNVCRHRAGPVAAGRGRCRLLRCGYHGWVYQLDGTLQHAPEMGPIAGFDKARHSLHRLPVREAGPLVFARPPQHGDRNTEPAIEAIVREIDARVGPGVLAAQRFSATVSYLIDCNWKVYVDNYLEGYHIPQVHPSLARILDYRDYATETHDGYSLQHSQVEDATAAYQAGEALYYFIFPNLMLNILPGRLQTNVVIPLAADRCRVDFVYYYAEGTSAGQVDEDISFGDVVQREDVGICEQVQRGLASGVYDRGRLSVAREGCVHHWHEWYKTICRRRLE